MEKRLLIAVLLSAAVLIVWPVLFPPPELNPPAPPPTESSPFAESVETPVAAVPSPAGGSLTEAPTEVVAAVAEELVEIETEEHSIVLTNRGGRIVRWELIRYSDENHGRAELIPRSAQAEDLLPLELLVEDLDAERLEALNRQVLFTVDRKELVDGSQRVRFVSISEDGLSVEKTLEVPASGFESRLSVRVTRRGVPLSGWVFLGPGFGSTSAAPGRYYAIPGGRVVAMLDGSLETRAASSVDEASERLQGQSLRWAGLDDSFFAALAVPEVDTAAVLLRPVTITHTASDSDEKELVALGLELRSSPFTLYVGPKSYDAMKSARHDYMAIIFGTNSFTAPLTRGLFLALKSIYDYVGNYGVAIILLTIALRLLFFPLMQRSMKSMRETQEKMKVVQPKIKEIQERNRRSKDPEKRQKLNQDMMNLYQKHGINPMSSLSGCLPMLIQLPILWAFYRMLSSTIELRNASFLYLADLSAYDPWYITPVVMGVTMYVQQRLAPTGTADPSMRRMMNLMPLIFTFFMRNLPSGVVLYWLVNNVLGIGQQYLVNRSTTPETGVPAHQGKKSKSGKRRIKAAIKEKA